MIGSPPTTGERNAVKPWRSSSRMNSPPASTGVAGRTSPCVTMMDQTNRERLLNVIPGRSEEHTSELQSPCNLVCRLLLEKKNKAEKKQAVGIATRCHDRGLLLGQLS